MKFTIGFAARLAGLLLAAHVQASPPPDYGIDWVTVGSPGNRATQDSEVPVNPGLRVGAVGYEYRIGRTELTNTQWLEFVNAYAPYWTGSPSTTGFTGLDITYGPGGYTIDPGAEQAPASMMWRMAARYCNWLHNEKRPEQWAFESGAYDTSTFSADPFGGPDEQATRSPGAKYWIPSQDEWIKAAFYDPNRYGPGLEGYWQGPNRSDEILVSGLPSDGGQTSAGIFFPSFPIAYPVGTYPEVFSPWGLLEVSGGKEEWMENLIGGKRLLLGSGIRDGEWTTKDRPDSIGYVLSPGGFAVGFRIASQVPEPCIALLFLPGFLARRSRR